MQTFKFLLIFCLKIILIKTQETSNEEKFISECPEMKAGENLPFEELLTGHWMGLRIYSKFKVPDYLSCLIFEWGIESDNVTCETSYKVYDEHRNSSSVGLLQSPGIILFEEDVESEESGEPKKAEAIVSYFNEIY